jgi:class 3 adenylate cyclase
MISRFDDPALEAEYQLQLAGKLRRTYLLAWAIGQVISWGMYFIDPLALPAQALFDSHVLRYTMTMPFLSGCVVIAVVLPDRAFARVWHVLGAISAFVILLNVTAFSVLYAVRGYPMIDRTVFYGVLCACFMILSTHATFGLGFKTASAVSLAGSALYVGTFFVLGTAQGLELFITFWVIGSNGIGMVCSYALEGFRRNDFALRREVERERERSEALLLNVLPASIAERLKSKPEAIADGFAEATVLFADIVGFTDLAAKLTPAQVVDMLNRLFTGFDDLAAKHGLEKIKTIGDAYMVVGGIPSARADHAEAVADMALAMREVVASCAAETGHALNVRIGIHLGPVVAGVIGKRKFAYDLWGDAVNTASRMESHGIAGQIQVSEAVRGRLAAAFVLRERGPIQVKGKGEMNTFLLERRA